MSTTLYSFCSDSKGFPYSKISGTVVGNNIAVLENNYGV
jgi:hypothetical protein